MSTNSAIAWTNHTVNFWTGCKKVSEGCKFCYMYRDKERYGKNPSEIVKTKLSTIMSTINAAQPGDMIFTCSWSDFFIEEADAFRAEAWDIIRAHKHLIWQILTKRPERIAECLPPDWGNGWENVWLGVSAENQKNADIRIPLLLSVPAKIRFISCEPLIDKVDLWSAWLDKARNFELGTIDWVIVGGESGNETGKYQYRSCYMGWIETIVDQCLSMKIPVFVKQLGTHLAKTYAKAGDRHGSHPESIPGHIRLQQFPNK